MLEWLIPVSLFWPLAAVYLGGWKLEIEGGGGVRQFTGLLLAFVLYLAVYRLLGLALGGTIGPVLGGVVFANVGAILSIPLVSRLGFRLVGVRIHGASGDAHGDGHGGAHGVSHGGTHGGTRDDGYGGDLGASEDPLAGNGGVHAGAALSVILAAFVSLSLLSCTPQGGEQEMDMEGEGTVADTGADAAGDMDGAEGDAMAAGAADVGCEFTVSGAELTNRLSPPDSSSVQLGGGVVKVCYGAPSARGRQIMGGLVPYGEPWRLGANEPTTLHVTVPVEIGDVAVQPGSYALYTIPGESEWEIVINGAVDRWGIPIDESVQAADIGSFTVTPSQTEAPVERLSIELRPTDGDAAEMVVEWENTRLSFPIQTTGA